MEETFDRLHRALRHLMHKNHELRPEGCAGCLEIAAFLTIPGYRGDEDDPLLITIPYQLPSSRLEDGVF